MNDASRGQVTHTAADIYEEFFVPALFQGWTEPILAVAEIQSGQSVLDVAYCRVLPVSLPLRNGSIPTSKAGPWPT